MDKYYFDKHHLRVTYGSKLIVNYTSFYYANCVGTVLEELMDYYTNKNKAAVRAVKRLKRSLDTGKYCIVECLVNRDLNKLPWFITMNLHQHDPASIIQFNIKVKTLRSVDKELLLSSKYRTAYKRAFKIIDSENLSDDEYVALYPHSSVDIDLLTDTFKMYTPFIPMTIIPGFCNKVVFDTGYSAYLENITTAIADGYGINGAILRCILRQICFGVGFRFNQREMYPYIKMQNSIQDDKTYLITHYRGLDPMIVDINDIEAIKAAQPRWERNPSGCA